MNFFLMLWIWSCLDRGTLQTTAVLRLSPLRLDTKENLRVCRRTRCPVDNPVNARLVANSLPLPRKNKQTLLTVMLLLAMHLESGLYSQTMSWMLTIVAKCLWIHLADLYPEQWPKPVAYPFHFRSGNKQFIIIFLVWKEFVLTFCLLDGIGDAVGRRRTFP